MLSMFKTFQNTRTAQAFGTAAFFAGSTIGTALLTHHCTKNLPPEEREIYWDNYMDPEGCRDALNKYEHTKRKPK